MNEAWVGTDIVSVPRIADIMKSDHGQRFLQRIYTPLETTYCQSKPDPAQHFAGRFAAKEAIRKAIMSMDEHDSTVVVPFADIEIQSARTGQPVVNAERMHPWLSSTFRCKVSISHIPATAIAMALITRITNIPEK